jgi:hypothetical protein
MLFSSSDSVCPPHTHAHSRTRSPEQDAGPIGAAAFAGLLRLNPVIRHVFRHGVESLRGELRARYRVCAHVRLVVRTRALTQSNRCRASGVAVGDDVFVWLCERAPIWVVVHVCGLICD